MIEHLLALHEPNLNLIPRILYGIPSFPGVVPEHRSRSRYCTDRCNTNQNQGEKVGEGPFIKASFYKELGGMGSRFQLQEKKCIGVAVSNL